MIVDHVSESLRSILDLIQVEFSFLAEKFRVPLCIIQTKPEPVNGHNKYWWDKIKSVGWLDFAELNFTMFGRNRT